MALSRSLQRAYDDTNEAQARQNILEGIRRLQKLDRRSTRLKEGARTPATSPAPFPL